MSSKKSVFGQGKKLLIRAALKLALQTRSISALGVREIGRKAGLNPNTFYRHFSTLDDLGIAIIQDISAELRPKMHEIRTEAVKAVLANADYAQHYDDPEQLAITQLKLISRYKVDAFFDYVADNPEVFVIGISELHGASPVLRQALENILCEFSKDLSDDFKSLDLMPKVDDETINHTSRLIINTLFFLSADFIEYPAERDIIRQRARLSIVSLGIGAVALGGIDQSSLARYLSALKESK